MYSENEDFNDEYEENTNNNSGSLGDKLRDFYESNKKMVIILGGLLLLLIILLMMNSCSNNQSGSTSGNNQISILITPTENYLNIGNSVKLFASIEPKNVYDDPNFDWYSSDDSVASVDNLGNVDALKLGETTITVRFVDDKGKEYKNECKVNVIEGNKDIALTDVEFPEGEVLITRGDKYKLKKHVKPSNGFIESIVYTSSDTSIVSVDDFGEIKALSDGVAKIKMVVNGSFEDEIVINVVSDTVEPQIIINPETLLLDAEEITITKGDSKQLTYQALPTEAYVEDLKWTSSDESVAIVDEKGIVVAKNEGTAIITVESRNGKSDNISIKVEKGVVKVSSIEILSSKNLTMKVNDTSQIVANVSPSDATDKTVNYASTNELVAKVNSEGLIRALYEGSATITVTSNDGGYVEKINVIVLANSSSSSSSSSSGSSSSSSCSADKMITISSDSGGAIDTNKNGTEKVATNSKVTISTDSIGGNSSCGSIEELKYCYHKYDGVDCTPSTTFQVGDKIVMDIPSGEGKMQIKIKASLSNGKDLIKTYYMKFKNDGSGESSNESQEASKNNLKISNTSSTIEFENKTYVYTTIRVDQRGSSNSIYFCVDESSSTAKSATSASKGTYGFLGLQSFYYQKSGTCNKATGLSQGYWNVYVAKGSKVCAHAEIDGVKYADYCKIVG